MIIFDHISIIQSLSHTYLDKFMYCASRINIYNYTWCITKGEDNIFLNSYGQKSIVFYNSVKRCVGWWDLSVLSPIQSKNK